MSEFRVVLVGARGHGRTHLRDLTDPASPGHPAGATLVGVCDLAPLDDLRDLADPVPVSDSLAELLRTAAPDITFICTPIQTHADLAIQAMRAGSHVLVEKPPAPSLADYTRIRDAARDTGRACQVGFQDLGSQALPALGRALAAGEIGEVRAVGMTGTWVRDSSYYDRAPWAGRRALAGRPVVDGALTNPFAHGLASALRIAGAEDADDLISVETELYRAHPIEADDTACARLTTSRGPSVTLAVTLCAEENREPRIRIRGSRGEITLWYKEHRVRRHPAGEVGEDTAGGGDTAGGESVDRRYERTDLLANLIEHVTDPAVPLLAPLASMGAFMRTVEAIRTGPEPHPIDPAYQRVEETDRGTRRIVPGIDDAIETAVERSALFSELGLPWTRR